MLENTIIEEVLEIKLPKNIKIQELGLVNSTVENTLSFLDDENYLSLIIENKNITSLIINKQIANKIDINNLNIYLIIVDDPRYSFYKLYNTLAKINIELFESIIHPSAKIHPKAYVAENNVLIGEGVIIGSNTILGCDDAEVKRTKVGFLKVVHDGKLIIKDNVDIGSNCTIDKGFKNKDTIIGKGTVVSNHCMIAHSSRIGNNCLILQCIICGSVVLEDNVRISPGAVISNQITIGNNVEIGLGSIVVKNVKPNSKLSGYYAIDHKKFLYKYVKTFGKI